MKKQGIPKEAILNSVIIQGEDCAKAERLLDEADGEEQSGNRSNDKDKDRSRFAKYVKMREKGIAVSFVLEAASNQFVTASDSAKLEKILAEVQPTKSIRSIIAGHNAEVATPCSNGDSGTTSAAQDETPSSQSERSNDWFTPIQEKEDNEKVAFHRGRTSALASLVRKMVFTVNKTSRSNHHHHHRPRNKTKGASSIADDDMVVNSKTL
jgi:hypothetical protein